MKLTLDYPAREALQEQIRTFLDGYQASLEAGMPDQERYVKLLIVDHLRAVGKKMAAAGFDASFADDTVAIKLDDAEEASLKLMLTYLPNDAAHLVSMALRVEAPKQKLLQQR